MMNTDERRAKSFFYCSNKKKKKKKKKRKDNDSTLSIDKSMTQENDALNYFRRKCTGQAFYQKIPWRNIL
jgi:hypothetical protein